MIKNIQVQTHQKFREAFSSWIVADAALQSVVCIGITSNDELLLPAMAVVSDVPQSLTSLVGGGSSESYGR
jgi:hypothetical protein